MAYTSAPYWMPLRDEMANKNNKTGPVTPADWRKRAAGELKNRTVDDLIWQTPEGIEVKALYTADDLEGIEAVDSLPGFAPYLRGHRATMYPGRPWTIRQYAGFSTAEDSNKFFRDNLAKRGCRLHSIWPPIGALIPITHASSAMSVRPGLPSIP